MLSKRFPLTILRCCEKSYSALRPGRHTPTPPSCRVQLCRRAFEVDRNRKRRYKGVLGRWKGSNEDKLNSRLWRSILRGKIGSVLKRTGGADYITLTNTRRLCFVVFHVPLQPLFRLFPVSALSSNAPTASRYADGEARPGRNIHGT